MKRAIGFAVIGALMAGGVARAQESGSRYEFTKIKIAPAPAAGVSATFRVQAGGSIQSAVDRARAGDRIVVEPGVYHETVQVDRDGLTLVGLARDGERAVLDGRGQLGDAVQVSGSHFTIEGFSIRNYVGNGVVAHKARNVVFRDLVVDNAGLYGVYPVECTGVLVEGCVVSRIADAGIYVGQSRDIIVQNNEVFNNVAGIEIENSVNAIVANNSAHHNTGGILVFVLPNNPSKIGEYCKVVNNRVWANNHPNFGKPGTAVSFIPPGVGIFVMAADYTEVTRNIIQDNDSYGVSVISLKNSSSLEGKTYELDVQPDSDFTFVHDNVYVNNGTDPAPRYIKLAGKGGDLFWDGTGQGNAWNEDPKLASVPEKLPSREGSAAGGQ